MRARPWPDACALLLALLSVWPAHGAEFVTLDFAAAWQRVQAQDPLLAAARFGQRQALAEAEEADARRWPSLGFEARATGLDAPLQVGLEPLSALGGAIGLPPGALPQAYRIQDRQFANAALQAVQPLYAGGRIEAGRAAAHAAVAASAATVEASESERLLLLAQRFLNALLAREMLTLREHSLLALEQHERNALLLEQRGIIARAERLRASVALAEAKDERARARERLQLAGLALAALLDSPHPVEPAGRIPDLPETPQREQLQRQALSLNPALAAARHRRAQAEAAVEAVRGETRPSLGVFARRELYTRDLTLLEPRWAIGLKLNWSLYSGGQQRARLEAAKARADEIDARLRASERELLLGIDQALEQLAAARSRHAALAETRVLAEESRRAQQRAFEEGLATSLELIDAELALSRVSLGQQAARVEAWLALAAALHLSGQSAELLAALSRGVRSDGE